MAESVPIIRHVCFADYFCTHTHTQPLAKFKKVILSKVKEEWGNFPS
jgi:hypothetical protein